MEWTVQQRSHVSIKLLLLKYFILFIIILCVLYVYLYMCVFMHVCACVCVCVCVLYVWVYLCLCDVRGKHTCLGTTLELSIEQLKSEASLLSLCVGYKDSTQVIMSVSLDSKLFSF